MTGAEIVRAFFAALEAHQWDAAGAWLADDFVFRDVAPARQVLDRVTYLALQRALLEAMPDWSFNLRIVEERDSVVLGTITIEATHTANLCLLVDGSVVMPATGERIVLPPLNVGCAVHDRQVSAITLEVPADLQLPPFFDSFTAGLIPRMGERRFQPPHPPRLPRVKEFIKEATFPVYGPPGVPLGLTLCGTGCERSPWLFKSEGKLCGVGLNFRCPLAIHGSEREFSLSARDAHTPNLMFPQVATDLPSESEIFDTDGHRYQRFESLEALNATPGAHPPYLIDRMMIAGTNFAARIQYWTRPEPEASFWLASDAVYLAGHARGIMPADLLAALAGLVVVAPNSALCAQYEAECERWRHFYRG